MLIGVIMGMKLVVESVFSIWWLIVVGLLIKFRFIICLMVLLGLCLVWLIFLVWISLVFLLESLIVLLLVWLMLCIRFLLIVFSIIFVILVVFWLVMCRLLMKCDLRLRCFSIWLICGPPLCTIIGWMLIVFSSIIFLAKLRVVLGLFMVLLLYFIMKVLLV